MKIATMTIAKVDNKELSPLLQAFFIGLKPNDPPIYMTNKDADLVNIPTIQSYLADEGWTPELKTELLELLNPMAGVELLLVHF